MSRVKWALAALIILASLLVQPDTAQSVDVDPYLYKSLSISMYFQYDRDTESNVDSDYETLFTSFEQQYTFDILSNIISRWLMTYDAGLHFSRKTAGSPNSKATAHTWYTYFSTTMLPKTNIPLTMFLNNTRYTRKNTNDNDKTWRNKFTYGLQWYGRFRKLPNMHLTLKKSHHKTEGTHTVDSEYAFNLQKKIGSSDNEWDTEYSLNENIIQDNENSQISTNFRNTTDISRNTRLSIGAAAGKSENDNTENSVLGMNASLTSSSSKDFTHNHTYSFVNITKEGETEETNERHFYAGTMRYRVSDDVSTAASVSASTANSNSSTSTQDTDSLSAGASISYSATSHLTLSEDLAYSHNTSNSVDAGDTTLDDRTEFRATSTARYSNNYSWTNFTGSLSAGYSDTQTDLYEGGEGLDLSASAGFTNISIVPLVSLSTTGSYSTTRTATSDEIKSTKAYTFTGSNTVLKRFAELNGNYKYSESYSDTSLDEQKTTSVGFTAGSTYFETTPFSYSLDYDKSYDYFDGESTSKQRAFNIRHQRILLRGELTGSFRHTTSITKYEGGGQNSVTRLFTSTYKRGLTRSSFWTLEVNWEHKKVDEKINRLWLVKNALVYQLRSWLFTAEHSYKRKLQYTSESEENKIMLTAARSFGFYWQ
jgi:hypothetical protein